MARTVFIYRIVLIFAIFFQQCCCYEYKKALQNKIRLVLEADIYNGTTPDGLSSQCEHDYARYLTALEEDKFWAIAMLDADGTGVSGSLSGNLIAEGMYDQCRATKENTSVPGAIVAQYCLGLWAENLADPSLTEGLGFCIPNTCNTTDAMILLKEVYAEDLTTTDMFSVTCVKDPNLSEDHAAIATIVILSIIGLIVMIATAIDGLGRFSYHKKNAVEDISSALIKNKTEDKINYGATGNSPTNVTSSRVTSDGISGVKKGNLKLGTLSVDGAVKQASPVCEHIGDESNKNNKDMNNHRKCVSSIEQEDQTKTQKQNRCLSTLLVFSLLKTVLKITSAKHPPGSFTCFNGMRFLAMAWIILGHTFILGPVYKSLPNLKNRFVFYKNSENDISYMLINKMGLSVETFFVLSGFLVSLSFLKQLKRHNGRLGLLQWIMYYVHRYWRLTPVYALIILFFGNLYHYLGNGPFFPEYKGDFDGCKTGWYLNLLYVNNIFYTPCLGHSWYLACDFQYYIIAPVFLILIYYHEILGLVVLVFGFLGGVVANIVLYHKLNTTDELHELVHIYTKSWTRNTTYFLGMFLGWVIWKFGTEIHIPKILNLIGWIVAIALSCALVFAQGYGPFTQAGEIAFSSLEKPLIGCTICWIIFSCITGNGGIINTMLSWKLFVPLGKFTYVGYLLHPALMYFFFESTPVLIYYYDYFFGVYLFLANLTFTMGLSLIISAIFEVPMLSIEKIIFPTRK